MKKLFVPALLSIALMLSACGPASDEAQIEALVADMFNAIKAGDYNKIKAMAAEGASNPMIESEESFKMASAMLKDATYELSNIVVDGDEATATMKITVMGMDIPENEAKFKKVDGKWRTVN